MKGTKMNKQLIVKFAVKGVVGLVVSAGIGYAIKGEKALGVKIDELFTKTADVVTEN
jgi:hypothetical protein